MQTPDISKVVNTLRSYGNQILDPTNGVFQRTHQVYGLTLVNNHNLELVAVNNIVDINVLLRKEQSSSGGMTILSWWDLSDYAVSSVKRYSAIS